MSLNQLLNFLTVELYYRCLLVTGALLLCFSTASIADAQDYRPYYSNGNGYRPNSGYRVYPYGYRPNTNGYRPNANGNPYGYRPNPNGYATNPTNTTNSVGPNKAVTPEEAQKLYNRPKTNPPPKFDPKSQYPRIAGEFEEQKAILISVCELLPQHSSVLKRIAELTEKHVPLIILFNNSKQVLEATKVLESSDQELDHVKFMHFKLDTVWLRDFGPVLAEQPKGVMSIDFFYNGQRPTDDHFPRDWAKLTSAQHNAVPWTIQGGNLLSNGVGLALTTTRIFEDNAVQFEGRRGVDAQKEQREFVINEFKTYTNLKHIEVLQPLQNEKTKHVDMFAAFTGSEEVVVAKVNPRLDPTNARILDYNAQRLERIKIGGKPLKVHRIPVPVRRGTSWSPYTNVIIANKLVMMPVMQTDDRATMKEAINVYRKILPDHRVATVDITSMAKLEGALHCMSVHVPSYVELPEEKLVSFERAMKWANSQKSEEK